MNPGHGMGPRDGPGPRDHAELPGAPARRTSASPGWRGEAGPLPARHSRPSHPSVLIPMLAVIAIATVLGGIALAGWRPERSGSRPVAGEAASPPAPLGSATPAHLPACAPDEAAAGGDPAEGGLRLARSIRLDQVGAIGGIAFSTPAGSLLLPLAPASPERPLDAVVVSPVDERRGIERLEAPGLVPRAIAPDPTGGRILALADGGRSLVELAVDTDGLPRPGSVNAVSHDASVLGIREPGGMAIDPAGTTLAVLDSATGRIVRMGIAPGRPADPARALRAGLVCAATIEGAGPDHFVGLAFEPRRGHLLTLRDVEGKLDELTPAGERFAVRDLTSLGVLRPIGLAVGPTGDPTDAEDRSSVYVMDEPGTTGVPAAAPRIATPRVHELSLSALGPAPVAVSRDSHAELVARRTTSDWERHSPDPSGIAYDPTADRLVVIDAEVDEMRLFARSNVFVTTRNGQLDGTALSAFTDEPSDLAIDAAEGRWFVADDVRRRIHVVDLGPDGTFGTSDDRVRAIDTTAFGSYDPEGIAFGAGDLFIADGLAAEVYRLSPGANGRFDAIAPEGDDVVAHFDTRRLGQPKPEGIAYRSDSDTLLIVSNDRTTDLLEATTAGELVRNLDLSFLGARAPAGLAEAPSSDGSDRPSVYIVDRGVDNSIDPTEDDGVIHEIRILDGPPRNLLANPGFETGLDVGRSRGRWRVPDVARVVHTPVHSGRAALELPAPGEPYSVTQSIALVAGGHTYTISGWVAASVARGPSRLAVRLRWFDGRGSQIAATRIADYSTAPPGWDRFVTRVEAPEAAVSARFVLGVSGAAGRWVVDDLTVQP